MNDALLALLLDAGLLLGMVLLSACVVYGLLLALFPGMAARAGALLDRRYSSRRALRPLEIPRSTERGFYRHHRLFGSLILAGVAAFFFLYFARFPQQGAAAHLAALIESRPLAEALLDALTGFLLLANGLIGVFALLVIWRPSQLKALEARANRWISTRRALRDAERANDAVDRFAARRPRLAGALIVAGALYVLASLVVAMLR